MSVHDTALRVGASVAINLGIARADIPSRVIPFRSITLSGFYSAGDLGAGAVYVRGTSSGPMAVRDAAGTWWNLYISQGLRTGWCGAKHDGATDDTAAFRLAWDIACASSNPRLILEAGVMRITTATAPFNAVSGMVVEGTSSGAASIKWVEGSLDCLMGRRYDVAGRASNILFRDFSVFGTHGDAGFYDRSAHYPIMCYNVDGLVFERVRVEKSRIMAIVARSCVNVSAQRCVVRYCAADGINFTNCDDYDISLNLVEFVDDDAIAAHNDTGGRVDRRGTIIGNHVRFAQGIKALGMVTGGVHGNTVEFCMGQGVNVTTMTSGTEGRNAANGLVLGPNNIKNCIDRTIVDGLNSGAPYMTISGVSAQAGGLAAIPGENDTATGTVIDPYPYFSQSNDAGVSTDPVPGAWGISAPGNIFVRDIPSGVLLSSLGLGTFYTRNGPVDPTLTDAALRQAGYNFAGIIRGISITGGSIIGIGPAFSFSGDARVSGRAVGISGYDLSSVITISGSNTYHQDFVEQANSWDIDPLYKHTNRGANGTWATAGSPTAILIQNASGIQSIGSKFRNCCRISDVALSAGLGTTEKAEFRDAVIDCLPSAVGFSASNRGVGEIPRCGPNFWLRIVDADPTSSTFKQVLNTCKRQAGSIPTSGYYLAGMFVESTAKTVSSGKVLLGWARLTTGNAHVSGTDWSPVYGTTT